MKLSLGTIAAVALLGATLALHGGSPPSLAWQATPEPAAPVVIASEVLGRATPVTVADPELALGRVTIMPGAAIPIHRHPGTQIGVVVQGTLTYTVYTGEVTWVRADSPPGVAGRIGPGDTVEVREGDALIETPDAIHQGRNDGDVPVVIYVSTLFPAGAPGAIIVSGTLAP